MVSEGYSTAAPYTAIPPRSSVYSTVARDCLSPEVELLAGLEKRHQYLQYLMVRIEIAENFNGFPIDKRCDGCHALGLPQLRSTYSEEATVQQSAFLALRLEVAGGEDWAP